MCRTREVTQLTVCSRPAYRVRRSARRRCCSECLPEVVQRVAPAAFVGEDRFLVPQAAVGEGYLGGAVSLLEVELDQGLAVFVVPGPGEGEAVGWVDLGVVAAASVLGFLVGVAHDHPDSAAEAEVDLGVGG